MSERREDSGAPGRTTWALARYVFAATLVRSVDGGAVVAVVLLAQSSGKPGWMSGMLGAAIIAPHLLGPFIACRLDTADDGRRIIAVSALAHGLLLATAGLLLPVWRGPSSRQCCWSSREYSVPCSPEE